MEKLVFSSTGDGLIRALGPDLTPALKAKLRAAGFDVDGKFPPAWPFEKMTSWLRLIAAEVFPGVPEDEALRRIGRRFIQGWQGTLVGSATSQLLKVMGPRRSVERIGRAFRTSDNFTEVEFETLSANSAHVIIKHQVLHTYALGILEAGVEMVSKGGQVRIEKVEGDVATYFVEWT